MSLPDIACRFTIGAKCLKVFGTEAGEGEGVKAVSNGSVPHGRGQAPFASDRDMDVLGE